MNDTSRLDQVFEIIMKRMVKTGQAPHYTQVASELDVPGRRRTPGVACAIFTGKGRRTTLTQINMIEF